MSAPPVSPTDAAVRRASIDADASTATSSDRWLVLRHGGRDTDRWRVLFAFASYLDASARYQAERHNLRMGELALVHLRAPEGDATMVLRDSMGTGGARAVARARAVKERPILFSAPMVRAILDGRKTQTRRTVKLPKWATGLARYSDGEVRALGDDGSPEDWSPTCPHGAPGDRLWVRETWCAWERIDHPIGGSWARELEERGRPDILCRADFERRHGTWERRTPGGWIERVDRWQSSLLMPRWASRITLEVTDVRVERLQEITEEDARAEGLDWAAPHFFDGRDHDDDDREDPRDVGYNVVGETSGFARDNFQRLWESLHGTGSWDANPWVWRIAFRRVEPAVSTRGAP